MQTPEDLLIAAGWTLVREKKHKVWRCPCGAHQVTMAATPSDHRAPRNMLAQIYRCGCPSIEAAEAAETDGDGPSEEEQTSFTYYCHFCGAKLDWALHKHKWVYHRMPTGQTLAACLHHQGIPEWHRQHRAREIEEKRKAMANG